METLELISEGNKIAISHFAPIKTGQLVVIMTAVTCAKQNLNYKICPSKD